MNQQLPLRPATVAELRSLIGDEIGPSACREFTQERITRFADATEDRQWIHVDPERATAAFGSTIAHGLYTLSVGPAIMGELIDFGGFSHSLNYGYNKVRYPAPVPVNSRVRAVVTLEAVEDIAAGIANVISVMTYFRAGQDKPVCVAEAVVRVAT